MSEFYCTHSLLEAKAFDNELASLFSFGTFFDSFLMLSHQLLVLPVSLVLLHSRALLRLNKYICKQSLQANFEDFEAENAKREC